MTKLRRFFGVKSPNLERFIDITKVVFWSIEGNVLTLTLEGGYTLNDGEGNAEYSFHLNREDGADLLLKELRSLSVNLWEEYES